MTRQPKAIRIICIIGFAQFTAVAVVLVAAAFILPDFLDFISLMASVPGMQALPAVVAIMLVSLVGMWLMRKWGAILYAVLAAAIWALWYTGRFPQPPIGDTIMAGLSLLYLRQMTWGVRSEANPAAVEQRVEADEAR